MTAWLNGRFLDEDHAISIRDRGFLLGDGAFETVLVENGAPLFWPAHEARLRAGLDVLGIAPPAGFDRVPEVVAALARREGLSSARAALRATVSRGVGPRGLAPDAGAEPTFLLTLSPAPVPCEQPMRRLMIVEDWPRRADAFAGFKHIGGYGANIAALAAARARGADDALMLNGAGRLACGSAGNVFVIDDDGQIATPPTSEGALPGIVRAVLLARFKTIEERAISPHELPGARLVLTNSLVGLIEGVLVDGASVDEIAPPRNETGARAVATLRDGYVRACAEAKGR